ncbi:MAG: efflux RND transporter periplasmic adaptor subunit [Acidobacteria bacterium]|nr:efflux RND transporter periplasmic adaptor subunit [Acidobacteriota bacterium]
MNVKETAMDTRAPALAAAGPVAAGRRVKAKHGTRRRWVAAAMMALVVLAAVGTWVYESSRATVEYVTTLVDRGDIHSTVTTTGNLNAVTTVQVGSQVSGNIKELHADFNTKVTKGQLVALIDPAPFQAAVDQSKAVLNSGRAAVMTAQATLAKSQSDLASALANVASQKANVTKALSVMKLASTEAKRRETLIRQNATSQEDFDTAKASHEQAAASVEAAQAAERAAEASAQSAAKAVDVATAQLQQAQALVQQNEAALSQAQLNLDHTRILAPVDGTVQSRNMDVGQTVAASFQAPTIFVIAQDLTKMQVDTNVGEADVAVIRLDQEATFTVDAYPGETFHGVVRQIRHAPINVQNVITYDVVIGVSNPELKLFPGMTANVTIQTNSVASVLRIPKSALRFRPRSAATRGDHQTPTVYVLDANGQPKPQHVQTGIADAMYVELQDNSVHEGEALVVGMKGGAATRPAQSSGGGPGGRRYGF